MKVLILSHSSGAENMGGAELTLLEMIDRWRQQDSATEFLVVARAPAGQLQPQLESRGVPHRTIPFDSWVLPLVRNTSEHVILTDRMDGAAVAAMRGFMREFEPDLVVTNTIVSPWAAFAAKLEGLPHVWFVHEYGDLDHGLGFRIGRDATFSDIGLLSELVVANSETIRDHLCQWIPAEKLTIAYPPIELRDEFALDHPRHDSADSALTDVAREDSLSVVMVGRISRSKGQWRLVEAVDRLRAEGLRVHATLVGFNDSPDGRELASEIEVRALSGLVEFAGERSDPGPYVSAADVAVMASDCEAFGRVTVEYMAAGVPVVAANTGANPELIVDGDSGWLFEGDSIDSLAAAIRLAAIDVDERERRGRAARARVSAVVLRKHPLEEAILRMSKVAEDGAIPMRRLPAFTAELLSFPRFVDQYSVERDHLRAAVRSSATWRLGTLVMKVARPVLPVARGARRAARRARQLRSRSRGQQEDVRE